MTVADDADIISFPATVNLSENIRNVVTIPGSAKNVATAGGFICFERRDMPYCHRFRRSVATLKNHS